MDPIYVVTDIETDGPNPGANSMLSFASISVDANGEPTDEFQAVLEPLEGAKPDPHTLAWFKSQPEAWAAATENPIPAADIIERYVRWVRRLPGNPIFVAHPLVFDGLWMDFYLRKFAGIRLFKGSAIGERLFYTGGLCLQSFAAGRLGWPLWECRTDQFPAEWLSFVPHTHRAIDDARGSANLLVTLMKMPTEQTPPNPLPTGEGGPRSGPGEGT